MNKIRAVIFDLGGTLINYEGLPLYWGDYYKNAFQAVREKSNIDISDKQIDESIDILKKYNPRLYPREIEYSSDYIFSDVIKNWNIDKIYLKDIVSSFFSYFRKNVIVYKDTYTVLQLLKEKNFRTGILTDLPTGMPDELIEKDIISFKDMIDYFVTSAKCGYRKPNEAGLVMLSTLIDVPIDEMIFIGDEEKDIKTAQNVGCISVLINRSTKSKAYGQAYEVNELTEILKIMMM